MTVQNIINNAVKRLKLEGKIMTPDFYAEAFCKEASRAKVSVEDCNHVSKFTKTLNKEFQKDIKNYHIKTIHEFIRFIVSKLNRTNPTQCTDTLESQNLLTKRILQVVEVLHNKEASELAKNTIEIIALGSQPDQLDAFRQRWVNFLTTYDDTFLKKLDSYGDIDTKNLKRSVENLQENSSLVDHPHLDLEKISKLLISSFVPSIASSVNDTIANLSEKIRKNPSLLESISIEKEIRFAISLRIALDKDSVKEMVESIDGVLDKLSLCLIDIIEYSDSSTVAIQAIKKELESYSNGSTGNFKVAHKKLYTIAIALEENTQLLSKDLKDHSGDVQALCAKIKRLENELKSSREELKEDFLTKLYNRRALDELMTVKEAEYERYGHDFTIVMFDLDKFKVVNDNYGHNAGDAVLSAFGKILKKECRTVDVVGRFGGEEFLAILSKTDINGGIVFAEKVRNHILKARFIYAGERINVTVSCGVSNRDSNISLETTIKSADKSLYKAKEGGRNRVESKK
ncbi:GGDEF domain-containing protein [Sulfurimonas sp.]|uniref:GGDEF domain-containing protein n=1 Tax=Sulfurimonas sp. TaxID=2022749 RepID=UPI0025F92DA6|nr:GGDEF domain-containing protein [Sulfurimonas sp.]MBT5934174.1 GGDEF domain-containing protein [Sulfurimonas sp.]